ncbi:MAG: S8 family serine peptidase, partial [Pseudomonadota bacterium]
LSSGMLNGLTVYHADVVSVSGALGEVASVDSMLKGLNWLIEKDVKLINISLAGPYNKILDRAFQRAAQEGAIIVAAAGNAGPANKVQYPAAFESTLAVTAVDADAKVYTEAVQGKSIDFSAPGVDVFIGDGKSGQYLSGTSVAAPFVTLRIAGDPSMAQARSVASVRGALSKDVQDLGEAGHDITFGFGLIMAPMPCRNIETAQHE